MQYKYEDNDYIMYRKRVHWALGIRIIKKKITKKSCKRQKSYVIKKFRGTIIMEKS